MNDDEAQTALQQSRAALDRVRGQLAVAQAAVDGAEPGTDAAIAATAQLATVESEIARHEQAIADLEGVPDEPEVAPYPTAYSNSPSSPTTSPDSAESPDAGGEPTSTGIVAAVPTTAEGMPADAKWEWIATVDGREILKPINREDGDEQGYASMLPGDEVAAPDFRDATTDEIAQALAAAHAEPTEPVDDAGVDGPQA